jgi:hypothetical protein
MKLSILASLATILLFGGCSAAQLTPEGEKVRVLDSDEVTKCQYVGRTTATVTEKVAGVRRHNEQIWQELVIVARNAAINLDGDTVVAESEEAEGKQKFKIYRCVPR